MCELEKGYKKAGRQGRGSERSHVNTFAISMSIFTAPIMKPLPCLGIIGLKCSPFSKIMLMVNTGKQDTKLSTLKF